MNMKLKSNKQLKQIWRNQLHQLLDEMIDEDEIEGHLQMANVDIVNGVLEVSKVDMYLRVK